jgi:REP element-mobilizing transposase RayT
LETLKHYKEKSGYEIYAYCFMSNHVHLLIKDTPAVKNRTKGGRSKK